MWAIIEKRTMDFRHVRTLRGRTAGEEVKFGVLAFKVNWDQKRAADFGPPIAVACVNQAMWGRWRNGHQKGQFEVESNRLLAHWREDSPMISISIQVII